MAWLLLYLLLLLLLSLEEPEAVLTVLQAAPTVVESKVHNLLGCIGLLCIVVVVLMMVIIV